MFINELRTTGHVVFRIAIFILHLTLSLYETKLNYRLHYYQLLILNRLGLLLVILQLRSYEPITCGEKENKHLKFNVTSMREENTNIFKK